VKEFLPGLKPVVKPPDPRDHPFTPVEPGRSACKWCPFAITAHHEVAADVQLHEKDESKMKESE